MISKRTLASIALLALHVGFAFSLVGIGLWFFTVSPQSTSTSISDVPTGFVFGNSQNLTQDATYFRLYLENVDYKKGTIKTKLNMIVVSQEMENPARYNDTTLFFLLQIPSNITDVKVDYHMSDKDPQFYGGKYEIINSTVLGNDLSAILVEIPRQNFTFGDDEFLAFYFTMNNFFSNVNSYTYQRAVTFGNNFDDAVDDLALLNDVEYRNTAVFRFLHTAELYVEEPYHVNSQFMPLPHGIHYYSNHTNYSWDINTIATSVGSDSVILKFEDVPAKEKLFFLENVMWFSLGLGIPLFISSLFEFLREDGLSQIRMFTSFKSKSHRNTKNMSGNVNRIIKACLVALFMVVVIAVIWASILLEINVESSTIPSLVNGMTSSISLIVGISGAVIGMGLQLTKENKKARNTYFKLILFLAVPLTLLWSTYSILAFGAFEVALRIALCSLIFSVYYFMIILLFSVKALKIE